ncbi:DUF222 domain-containing protein [Modestobacter sp. URMC 112]
MADSAVVRTLDGHRQVHQRGQRPLDELAREITAGAVRLASATAAWLGLVAEFDEREGWGGVGIQSCAHWLAWQCALSPGAAREHVRVARALTALPVTAAAFAAGRLSFSKVRAVTRVADPGTEVELVELAVHTTASQLERVVRAWRRSDDVDEGRVAERREFAWSWDDDGMLTLRVRMDAESGAQFLASIESAAERDARRDRAADKRAGAESSARDGSTGIPRGQRTARRIAALKRLAAVVADADRRPGDPPRREVVVHVDAEVLADDAAAGRAHLEGGPALHPSRVRRMLCEASVVGLVHRNGEPLALGRRRRLATPGQRRALLARDGGCARPGCEETRVERLHAHHLRHWLHGGRTDVSNLVLLCDVDHGLVHEHDLVMSRADGELVVHDAEGRRVWGPADAAFTGGVGADLAAGGRLGARPDEQVMAGVHPIDRSAGCRPAPPTSAPAARPADVLAPLLPDGTGQGLPHATGPTGERMDLHHVVWALLAHRDHLRRSAA